MRRSLAPVETKGVGFPGGTIAHSAKGVVATPEDIERFRRIIYERTGIRFDDTREAFLRARVESRVRSHEGDSVSRYLERIQTVLHGDELQQIVNDVTVNETYFFRESYQLDCLVRSMLPEVVANNPNRTRLQLWSLPCSTGEEPYSIAIQLLEEWPLVDRFDVEVYGSDIDTAALAHARRGRYHARSVRSIPMPTLRKYFTEVAGEWEIADALRGSVEFARVNVCDQSQMATKRGIDVVFCRNLLIYFDDRSKARAIDLLYEALEPGGFLCLGHSESLGSTSSCFQLRKFPDAIVYQKPLEAPR